jgi:conjugal transfer pilus assembly protein TraE
VEYEAETDKVFVTGYAFEKGPASSEHRSERSYEYRLQIAHYAPLIRLMKTYEGPAQTQKRRAQFRPQTETLPHDGEN